MMLYGDEYDDAHLQRLVLGLRNTAALAGIVRDFVSERQAGVQLWVLASRCNMLEQRVGGLPTWHTWLERMPAGLRKKCVRWQAACGVAGASCTSQCCTQKIVVLHWLWISRQHADVLGKHGRQSCSV